MDLRTCNLVVSYYGRPDEEKDELIRKAVHKNDIGGGSVEGCRSMVFQFKTKEEVENAMERVYQLRMCQRSKDTHCWMMQNIKCRFFYDRLCNGEEEVQR